MHKLIFDTFEFDLTPYNISTVEDNQWFLDEFSTSFSFPFTFKLTDELLVVFGDLLDDNAKFIKQLYNVTYVLGNKMESCIFEIESQIGLEVTSTFRFGFDDFPNFDKKLSELPLEETTVSNVYDHAVNIISQTWPAVNYNYPQIHTDEYADDTNTWDDFKDVINNYDGNGFLVNSSTNGLFINRNIIQPIPFLLHVLKQGFLDAGYTLKGDILEDETIKQLLLFYNADYFNQIGNIIDYKLTREQHNNVVDEPKMFYYDDTIQLKPDSTYIIKGFLFTYYSTNYDNHYFAKIKYKDDVLVDFVKSKYQSTKNVEITFKTDSNTDLSTQILVLTGASINFEIIPFDAYDYLSISKPNAQSFRNIFDIEVTRQSENEKDEIEIIHDVNLKEVVPNITFGSLFYAFKKMFNLESNIVGKEVYINFLENSINKTNMTDLSNYLVKKPKRSFPAEESFLLAFSNMDEYLYEKILVPEGTILTGDVDLESSRTEIEIDSIPLPIKTINGIETAFSLGKDESQIYFTLYNGLNGSLNTINNNGAILIPNLYNTYHKNWFYFLLNAIDYTWVFKMYLEELEKLNKKVFAYGRHQVIETIDKTQIGEDLFEVEIETKTLP